MGITRRLSPLGAAILLSLLGVLPSGARATALQSQRTPAVTRSGATGALGPLITISQTLNNCGPASVAEVLAYWHVYRTQDQTQAVLRGDSSPYGMAPYGVPTYARSLGLEAMVGAAGTDRLLKALISNGFPVIVSQWVSLAFRVRHYRPIEAYDDRRRLFVSSDPYLGAGHAITYGEFDAIWSVSDGRFIVIYPRARAALLRAVLASTGWDRTRAYGHDLAWEQARMRDHRASGPDTRVPSGWRYYGYPSLAWDEVELRRFDAARRYLSLAAGHGGNPLLLRWVEDELRYLQSDRSAL
ncbi:MAG: C39 family peptidase [Chloroflexi bacterium]|nr:C39 family peptidase [Chloroflexota bacterium]